MFRSGYGFSVSRHSLCTLKNEQKIESRKDLEAFRNERERVAQGVGNNTKEKEGSKEK